ncbi:MAG: hypothetical protein ACYDAD_01380 [Acidimicrobiales bacterium]
MKYTSKIGAGLGALVLAGGIGALTGLGQAVAATPGTSPLAKVVPASATTDSGPDVQQGGNTQVGDQTGPDASPAAGEKPETSGEAPESHSAEADGPGGHQDAPGAAGANTQQ